MIVDELRKQVDDMLRVNDEMQAEVQRLTAERDQLRARVVELEAGAPSVKLQSNILQLALENEGLRARAAELEAKQHDCAVAERLSNDAHELVGLLESKLAAADALEWIAPFLRGNGHAVFAEQIESTLAKLRGGQ